MPKQITGRRTFCWLLALLACLLNLPVNFGCERRTGLPASTRPYDVRVPSRVERLARWEVELPGADRQIWRAQIASPSKRNTQVHGFAAGERAILRFAPRELGRHHYQIERVKEASVSLVAEGDFDVVPATKGANEGFVGTAPERPTQFTREDGARVFLLGENRFNIYDPAWNYQGMSIEEYIAYMASHGENALRLFVFNDCDGEEQPGRKQPGCLEPQVGQIDADVADDFERIFVAAERHGVYVILSLFAVGFTPDDVWKGWEDNPYNRARGGLVDTPEEFFTSEPARAFQKKRIDYVVDRYGAYTSFLAIDLLNEPEWDGKIGEETWLPWARDLGQHFRARDPYGHLVTAGPVGLHWNIDGDERAWYESPENDVVQWHLYGEETYASHALNAEISRKVEETRSFNKPILLGEFGYGGEDKLTFDHTHVGIWTATFNGAGVLAHSAPVFEIDSDQPMVPARAAHFRVLREYLDALGDATSLEVLPPEKSSATPSGTRVLALGDERRRALWIMGPEAGYGEQVVNAVLHLADVPCQRVELRWWNDTTGELLHKQQQQPERTASASDSCELSARIPSFVRHVAGELTLADQPEGVGR